MVYALFKFWHLLDMNSPVPLFSPLADRIHAFIRETGVGMTSLLLSLLYITRLRSATPSHEVISLGSEYRVFCISVVVAQKWLKDDRLSNRYWARTSGIELAEVNAMEMHCLQRLGFKLIVDEGEWERWKVVVNLWEGRMRDGGEVR
jgi:hypothetical protein